MELDKFIMQIWREYMVFSVLAGIIMSLLYYRFFLYNNIIDDIENCMLIVLCMMVGGVIGIVWVPVLGAFLSFAVIGIIGFIVKFLLFTPKSKVEQIQPRKVLNLKKIDNDILEWKEWRKTEGLCK